MPASEIKLFCIFTEKTKSMQSFFSVQASSKQYKKVLDRKET